MTSIHKLITAFTTLITATICVLLIMIWVSSSALADDPTRPDPGGPTRPDSNSPSQPDDHDDDGEPPGAYIELQAQPVPTTEVWAVVQWQDSSGGWHNVDGWQGTLDMDGRRRWWVAEKDFGTGPFRWVVRQGQDIPILEASEPFNLPAFPNETKQVTVIM